MFSLFRRRKKELVDFRGEDISPVEAERRAGGRKFVVDVPVEKIRAAGFSGADPQNPFVLTLRAYGEGRCGCFRGSLLENFYERWQPFAGSDPAEARRPSPWSARPPRPANTAAGRLQRGEFLRIASEMGLPVGEMRGHILGGPVTEAFGEVTFRRIARIYDSVREKGYRPEDSPGGHLRGHCFVRGDDFRVSVGSGKHRVAALLALGWRVLPVQMGPPKIPVLIRREEADEWPGVRGGLSTREEALAEFDRIFSDLHPSGWRPPDA